MNHIYDAEEVRSMIRKLQSDHPTARELAEYLDISPCHLSNIFAGRKDPGPKILKQLGLRKVRTYAHHYEKVEE